ncbi:multicopper oxidase domain-containing protein [Azospirillum sp. SYSU D00513]|uniref:multicopper oxidase family protein n=1 Tax=Azospirillum sp. SYSU D00513 TaxID=2812561 RepID=UPI001A970D4E|nr:multicopper oxidase domain-containing protein [Azospirillum sp. SYSU D00513]
MSGSDLSRVDVSRRSVLLGSTALVAAAAVPPAMAQGHAHAPHPGALGSLMRSPGERPAAVRAPTQAPTAALTAHGFPQPLSIPLAAGGPPSTLTMKPGSFTIGDRDAKNLRVYEGAPFGPTLRMGQTGTYQVTVVNRLGLNPDQAAPHIINIPSQFNTTNLHTHGLHVSPNGVSDNVYIEILPEGTAESYAQGPDSYVGSLTYRYELTDHTPGTFWYHPHRHGSVAVQVASGAAGALVIDGGPGTIDAVPEIAAAAERVMLLQQVALTPDGTLPDFDALWSGTAKADWSLNGTVNATMPMQPGEVQRWRFVNTGFASLAKVQLTAADGSAVPLQLIAVDGVNFTKPATVQAVYLVPGGRADVLVKAPDKAQALTLLVGGYVDIAAGFEIGGRMVESPFDSNGSTVLLTVKVSGDPKPMPLPAGPFPAPIVPDVLSQKPSAQRYLEFTVAQVPEQAPPGTGNQFPSYRPDACPSFKFYVNGELFCPGRVMFQPRIDTVEEWQVFSPGPDSINFAHIFHIHVNPFLVTEVEGQSLSTPQWRDTMIAGAKGYKALTKYTEFAGTFPIHCHILEHEDIGMMTNVSVIDPKNPTGQKHAGHH